MEKYEQSKWIFEGEPKYLDVSKPHDSKVCIATFPRSGNTFIRKALETITGITTGSDCEAASTLAFPV